MMTPLAKNIFDKTQKITSNDIKLSQNLINLFFTDLKNYHQEIPTLIESKQLQELSHLFHKLSGSCGYFGTESLRLSSIEMEKICRRNDWLEFELQLAHFQQQLTEVLAQEEALADFLKEHLN